MNGTYLATAAHWSYGLAAAGYLLLAARMVIGRKRSLRGALLIAAVVATAVWAAVSAFDLPSGSAQSMFWPNAADTLRYAAWYGFVASLLASGPGGRMLRSVPRWLVAAALALMLASVLLSPALPMFDALGGDGRRGEFAARVGMAVLGLVLAEQLYRRAHIQARWAIKPMVLALVAMFGFDLFLYADALLFGSVDVDVWLARALANALVIPLIAMATARNTGWTIDMHVSRQAVVQSTALVVSGAFLLAVAVAGYVVRYFGGDWGRALQIELLFAALVFLAIVATSESFRARLRVFVSKHFFSYRYDYREEWLRFTQTLASDSPMHGVHARAIKALADLVESPAGVLWLARDGGDFQHVMHLNWSAAEGTEPRTGSLAQFLARSGWVVTLPELATHPERYAGLSVPPWLAALPNAWLVVPLSIGETLEGFVVLAKPRAPVEVDWEVRDLLKAAARAAAGYLRQIGATEALLEARKFDAFNRMSAFVVHDLKNLVAQLSLMLRNAERHRDNPEFQRDMLSTVEHVVTRMNHLMLQLRTGATPVEKPRPTDLESVVRRVCATKEGHRAPIELDLTPGVYSVGHEDRLDHVIAHLVQNALDATAESGGVSLRLRREGPRAVLEVADTGVGMTPEFVRDRLFKPFETSKASGMGIGVYESSQYVSGLGGQVLIDSEPGVGTRVRVMLPAADGPAAAAEPAAASRAA